MKKLLNLIDIKLLKFILVGALNTLIGSAIMFGLYNLAHCSYWGSSAANYIITSVISYFLNKYFTFQDHERGFKPALRFAINVAVCFVLAYGIAEPLCRWLLSSASEKLRDNVSMLVGMCLFSGFNYIGQRLFTFKNTRSEERRVGKEC